MQFEEIEFVKREEEEYGLISSESNLGKVMKDYIFQKCSEAFCFETYRKGKPTIPKHSKRLYF